MFPKSLSNIFQSLDIIFGLLVVIKSIKLHFEHSQEKPPLSLTHFTLSFFLFLFSLVIKSCFNQLGTTSFLKGTFVFGFGDKKAQIFLQGMGTIGGKTGKTMILPWFWKKEHGGGSGGMPPCYSGLSLPGHACLVSGAPGKIFMKQIHIFYTHLQIR